MASKEQAKKVLLVADNDANREILKYNEQVENYNALVIKYNGSRVPVAGGKYSGRTITNIDEVEINPNGKYAYGVDIGGTTVKIGYFSTGGELLDKWEIPTVKTNQGEQILPDIAKSIKEHMAKKKHHLRRPNRSRNGCPRTSRWIRSYIRCSKFRMGNI